MSSPADHYRQYVEQSQQAFQTAVDTWTRTVEQTVSAIPANPTQVDPQQVIDQVFDFAGQMLQMQREFTKRLVASSVTLSKGVSGQVQQDVPPASDA